MGFNFSSEEFFDNHTHLLFQDKLNITCDEFAINYYHGIRDEAGPDGRERPSSRAVSHLPYLSVVMTLVHLMAERFDLEPTLEAVVAFRNSQTKTPLALAEYTKMLYEDQNITGCMLDSEHPMSDPRTLCFPCKLYRLYQYENVFFELLKKEERFEELLRKLYDAIKAAAKEGFAGLKGHIGEKCGMDVREVSSAEAQAALPKARNGDKEAVKTIYYAMFSHLLEWCGEADLPLHLHTGTTGFKKRTDVYSIDPLLMAPFLKNPRYLKSKIFLLHGSFPFTRNAAIMAYNFPNVYLDLSQTLPWQSMAFSRILEDALSITPHDKILLGTGQHWYTEMAWVAAIVAKSSLAYVMSSLVEQNLLSSKQATQSALMILSQNALRVYNK